LLRVGQLLKKPGPKILAKDINPAIMLLQGIMTYGEKISQELSKIFSSWEFRYINAIMRSRGDIIGWKKCSFTLSKSWNFTSCLGTTTFSPDLGK